MSLLLDALKRAEAAKQQQGAQDPAAGAGGLSLDPAGVPQADAAPPLMTRDRLPDITQPLEILSDDLPSSASARQESSGPARPAGQPRSLKLDADPAPEPPRASAAKPAGDRDAARQLFEAKGVDYDPYRFIKIILGVAVGVAVAYGGYLYYQLQPRSAMVVNTSPPPPPAAVAQAPVPAPAPIVAAPATDPPAVPTRPVAPEPVPAASAAPAQPVAAAPAPAAAAGTPAASAAPAARPVQPRPEPPAAPPRPPQARSEPAAAAAAPPAPRRPAAPRPPAAAAMAESPVERGYRALESGDLQTARQEYLRALSIDRNNRDALLGLATIDMKTQNYGAAEARFARVLELDPRDAYAQAGMVTLRGQTDPVTAESRLKNLLATQPDANFLNFTLGNQYAAQSRWSEAQAAYFKAYSTDPDNPDFAYNLAVSLDQLRQPKLALEYYEKALASSATRPAAFARAQVEGRIRELTQ